MFRYVALVWDSTDSSPSAEASKLSAHLQARDGWENSVRRPGLHVFVTGTRPGINGTYPLVDRGVVVGRLFRRRQLDQPTSADPVLAADEAERILHGAGRALVDEHWGRYVAFMQVAPGQTCVLRDPSGMLPCYRIRHRGVWLVFSWLEDILTADLAITRPAIDWECLAAHVLFGELGHHETALEGVSQLLAGEVVQLGRESQPTSLLWNAIDIARTPIDEEPTRSAERLHRSVRECALSWAACHDSILLRLSGGVDSSILLGCLADGPARITCLNYHSTGSDSDERHYARLAATKAHRELIERERDPSFCLERVLDVARTPAPSSYLGRIGTARTDAELAAACGATAMFTGGGGDQLFFEFRRWWPAADYLRLRGLDTGFLAAAMDASRLGKTSVWKTIGLSLADRFRPSDPLRDIGKFLALIRSPLALSQLQRERFTHPALRAATDIPVGKRTQVRQLMFPSGYYDPYEREAAPELVNPLMSQPLVELCLRLPTYVLTYGGRGRGLARHAFEAELPMEIATRRSKGGMEEHVKAVLQRNLAFARAILLDGELVRRGILDRTRVEEALSGRPTALESHVGEFHVYIGIEAWLARWSSR